LCYYNIIIVYYSIYSSLNESIPFFLPWINLFVRVCLRLKAPDNQEQSATCDYSEEIRWSTCIWNWAPMNKDGLGGNQSRGPLINAFYDLNQW